MAPQEHPPWEKRYAALSRTQARYLWMLLALSIFFLAMEAQFWDTHFPGTWDRSHFAPEPYTVTIPFVAIPLSADVVRLFGSLTLMVLLRATLGSLRAARNALLQIQGDSEDSSVEAYDEYPNVIDMAVYLPENPHWLAYALACISYPLYLSLHFVVTACLCFSIIVSHPGVLRVVVWTTQLLTLAFAVPTVIGLAAFWRGRLRRAWGYRRKKVSNAKHRDVRQG